MADKPSERDAVLPREELSAWHRWQMPSFATLSEPAPPPAAGADRLPEEVTPAQIRLPTAEELAALYRDAETEAERRGAEAGRRAGQEAGYQAGMAAAAADLAQLRQILTALATPLEDLDTRLESAVLSLALELARQVIRSELRAQPEHLLPLLREALKALPPYAGNPCLTVHPDDAALLRSMAPEWLDQGVQVNEDPDLDRGSARLTAGPAHDEVQPDRRWRQRQDAEASTELDLRLATRWRQALERLFGTVPS